MFLHCTSQSKALVAHYLPESATGIMGDPVIQQAYPRFPKGVDGFFTPVASTIDSCVLCCFSVLISPLKWQASAPQHPSRPSPLLVMLHWWKSHVNEQ